MGQMLRSQRAVFWHFQPVEDLTAPVWTAALIVFTVVSISRREDCCQIVLDVETIARLRAAQRAHRTLLADLRARS